MRNIIVSIIALIAFCFSVTASADGLVFRGDTVKGNKTVEIVRVNNSLIYNYGKINKQPDLTFVVDLADEKQVVQEYHHNSSTGIHYVVTYFNNKGQWYAIEQDGNDYSLQVLKGNLNDYKTIATIPLKSEKVLDEMFDVDFQQLD